MAGLGAPGGPERSSEEFTPGEVKTRFCRVRDPAWTVGFDGHWRLELSALCEKRRRYGDCACQVQVQVQAEGEPVFESSRRRLDVHNGAGWMEFVLEGSAREARFAYPRLDRVTLAIEDLEDP